MVAQLQQGTISQQELENQREALLKEEKAANGQIVVKMKPKAVSETDDKVLADLMKKSEMDNAEVSGDEDHSEL